MNSSNFWLNISFYSPVMAAKWHFKLVLSLIMQMEKKTLKTNLKVFGSVYYCTGSPVPSHLISSSIVMHSSKMSLKSKICVFVFLAFSINVLFKLQFEVNPIEIEQLVLELAIWVIEKTIKNKRNYLLCLAISLN